MDFFMYYIVLTMSYCGASDEAVACDLKEDKYYFQNAVHCEQVRQEMSLMYEDFYSNVDLKSSTCEPLIVKLDNNKMPMWESARLAMEAAEAQMEYARQMLDTGQNQTD